MSATQMDLAQMLVRLGVAEGDIAALNKSLDQVSAKFEDTREHAEQSAEGVEEAGAEFGRFRSPVLEAVFAFQMFTGEVKESIAAMGELSGVAVAMEYNHIQNALDNVTGSAQATKEMLESLEKIKSPYLNTTLLAAAPKLINSGISPDALPANLKALVDMAAEGNMTNQEMPAFLDEMVKLRGEDHPMIRQLTEQFAGLPIAQIVNKGARTHFNTSNQAYDYLEGLRGNQAYDVLTKGAEALNNMAAATLLMKDPAMALEKTFETVKEVMLSTGNLLLPVLAPAVGFISQLATWIKNLNDETSGAAGLIAIVFIVRKNFGLLVDTFFAVIKFTKDLTAALRSYGQAAESDAIRMQVRSLGTEGAKEGVAGHAAAEVGLIARLKGWGEGLARVVKNPSEALKGVNLGEMVKGIGIARVADVATFAAGLGLSALGSHLGGRGGAALAGAGEGLGWGGLGMFLGPEVGIPTALLGAVVGAVVGARNFHADGGEHAAALKDNTAALREVSARGIGGGDRLRMTTSQISLELSLARLASVG